MNDSAWAQAFPINSDVALQPAEDPWIYRTQLRLRDFEVDVTGPDTEGHWVVNSHVLVCGYTSRLSMILAAPPFTTTWTRRWPTRRNLEWATLRQRTMFDGGWATRARPNIEDCESIHLIPKWKRWLTGCVPLRRIFGERPLPLATSMDARFLLHGVVESLDSRSIQLKV